MAARKSAKKKSKKSKKRSSTKTFKPQRAKKRGPQRDGHRTKARRAKKGSRTEVRRAKPSGTGTKRVGHMPLKLLHRNMGKIVTAIRNHPDTPGGPNQGLARGGMTAE